MAAGPDPQLTKTFPFSLDKNLAKGVVQLDTGASLAWFNALKDENALLPPGDTVLGAADISVAPGQDITVGPAKIGFSADVNAALGVFDTAAGLRQALLKNETLVAEVVDNLSFADPAGGRYLMLRWGYDLEATAAGSVALGAAGSLSFNANAGRKGYYAIVQTAAADAKARASLVNLIASWRLPSQVDDLARMPASTMILSEVDGSLGIGATVTLGYDFSWIRAVDGLGLKGDVGLKLKTGLSASIGLGISGKYAIALTRVGQTPKIHLRLYKLRVSNWNLGFDATATATPVTDALPQNFDDLLKAVTGTHSQQVMKLLGEVEDWTNPNTPIFGPFVNLVDTEAQKLIKDLTGVQDLAAAFNDVKGRIQSVFNFWNALPQTATKFLWSKLPDQTAIAKVAATAGQIAGLSEDSLQQLIQETLKNVAVANTTEGQTLEALAAKGLFAAIQGRPALKDIQDAAKNVQSILDGSKLQSLLTRLQAAVDTKLDLKKLETVVDQTTFASLDTWLKARLESFLEDKLVGADGVKKLEQLRAGLKSILDKRDELYQKALAALKKDYAFAFSATYQSSTTKSALLDADFDFGAPDSKAGDGLKLALAGKFDQLLAQLPPGVTINEGVLAYGLHKESHVSLSLPYFSAKAAHINDALAKLQLDPSGGGVVFTLEAQDLYTVRNNYASGLSLTLMTAGAATNHVKIHSADSATFQYDLKVETAALTAGAFRTQYRPYASQYFQSQFQQQPPGTFDEWAGQIADAGGKLGNTLVSLSLSLPSAAGLAWKNAPDNDSDALYKKMSMALQRQFKQTVHDVCFSNLKNYADRKVAPAVLAFCAVPACSHADPSGDTVVFAGENEKGKNIYWDYLDKDIREKAVFHKDTQANLRRLIAVAVQRIQDAGDPDGVLDIYTSPTALSDILNGALKLAVFVPLFLVEGNMVEEARKAGRKMASFLKNRESDPESARKDLARFGQKLSEDFNSNLQTIAVGNALLPLGTAIYTAAAGVLAPAASMPVAAMLTVQVLKDGVSTLEPQDSDILRTQRVVAAG